MAGTKAGHAKGRQRLIAKYGEEGYRQRLSKWGSRGGKKSPGFAGLPKQRRREIARLGQQASRQALIDKIRQEEKEYAADSQT